MAAETPLFTRLAAAYVRGTLGSAAGIHEAPLDTLSADQRAALIALGRARGLRLHRFKRTMGLPRVQAVIGILRGIGATDLLDIGTGRGAFLWPLLDAMPSLPVTATDVLAHRVTDIQRVAEGGLTTLSAAQANALDLSFDDRSFDVVTMLEVLEHIPNTALAIRSVLRVAQRFVIISVPSRSDDNPEHIHLFSAPQLTDLLRAHGAARVSIEYVPGHLIALAKVAS
ncbi:MAG: class I SAM-dependent methyltransferase [Oscillochloris sp.]|nr:class I SAM-dependent methyltransferase [Oscillochloris sp.]